MSGEFSHQRINRAWFQLNRCDAVTDQGKATDATPQMVAAARNHSQFVVSWHCERWLPQPICYIGEAESLLSCGALISPATYSQR
jgi:hypothetical protein